jgi:NodT family efflux transporter outer membrane factor (OMF) lipoprotein
MKTIQSTFEPRYAFIFSLFLMVGVAGCAHRAPEMDSPAESENSFSYSGAGEITDRWWTEFDDPILNHLVKKSLRGNLSIRQSYNRLDEARAQLRQAESGLFPSLDVSGDASESKTREDGTTSDATSTGLGLSASYEVDLWGRIESSADAARFERRATRQDLRSSAMSITAEVTRTWFQLVEQYAQRSILNQQLETNRQVLELVEKRFQLGRVRAPDVLRQRELVQSTLQQKASVESSIRTLEHRLAVLLGRVPTVSVNPVRTSLPDVPELPETGVPSEVINRRPDVRAAYLRVKSANKDVASAIAERYPRVTITGSLTTEGGDGVNLFDNWVQSIAADFALPLIDGGQRRAAVSGAKATLSRQLNSYRQSVLTAYEEIENALVRERKQREQIERTRKQLELSRQTVDRLRSQYLNGTINYLDVLNALESKQQLERDLISARRQLLEFRVALYRSLAGGFRVEDPLASDRPRANRSIEYENQRMDG